MLNFSLLPLAWKLVGIAAGATIIIGAYAYWHHSVEQSGYDRAIKDVAEQNEVATEEVREAVSKSRACRDGGGRWIQSRGVCS